MPIGIIVDGSATLIGALLGCVIGKHFSERFCQTLSCIFALSAVSIGITMIVSVSQLAAVILSLILGTIVGELLNLNRKITRLTERLDHVFQERFSSDSVDSIQFINIIVMFSISGYGIFGALNEGFTGDHSSLIVKAILDFFTIACYTSIYGKIMVCTFIPQLCVYLCLFFISSLVIPFVNPVVFGDLTACAGVITLATGINLLFKKDIPTISFLPSLILVVIISNIWISVFI